MRFLRSQVFALRCRTMARDHDFPSEGRSLSQRRIQQWAEAKPAGKYRCGFLAVQKRYTSNRNLLFVPGPYGTRRAIASL